MNIPSEWLIPSSIDQAKKAQSEMALSVMKEDQLPAEIQWIGGMDVSNNLYDPAQMIYASSVVLSRGDLLVRESIGIAKRQEFPYIPGLLGFREAPALIEAFQKLKQKPDLLFVDGHGISHPRGLGIASHLGVLLDLPTIGVAKSILVGKPDGLLGEKAGSLVPLVWKKKEIGVLLRTKLRSNPLIISIGHKISLSSALRFVQSALRGYRLPEPTRQAHLAANACRLGVLDSVVN